MFPLLKIYSPNEIKQTSFGHAASSGDSPVPGKPAAEDAGGMHGGVQRWQSWRDPGDKFGHLGAQQRLALWDQTVLGWSV